MSGVKSTAQFTIIDYSDATISTTQPNNPKLNDLWLDTSLNPPKFKTFNGYNWVVVNDYSGNIKDLQDQINNTNNDINNNQKQIEQKIKEVKEVQESDNVDIQKLKDRVVKTITHDDLTKTTKSINDKILSITNETNNNKHLIEETTKSTKDEILGINKKIQNIRDTNDSAKVAEKIEELTTKSNTLEKTLDVTKETISSIKLITGNNSKAIEDNTTTIEKTNKEVNVKLENVNTSVNKLDTKVADIRATAEELKLKFSNPNIKTGITTVNADGIKVKHENAGTETSMSSDGFVIKDKYTDRIVASFGASDNGSMSKLCVDEITCQNVSTYFPWGNKDLYVCAGGCGDGSGSDWSNKAGSIQSALDNYRKQGTVLQDGQTITVNVDGGIYNTDVKLYGFTGNGAIKLQFNENVIMKGSIFISDCTCSIVLNAGPYKYYGVILIPAYSDKPCISVVRSNGVYIRNFRHRGNGSNDFLYSEFARVSVQGCDVSNCKRVVYVSTCSTVSLRDNKGDTNSYIGIVEDGGTLSVNLDSPRSSNGIGNNWGGIINKNIRDECYTCFKNPPSPQNRYMTATFSPNSYRSWRADDGTRYGFTFQGGHAQYGYWVGHCNINCSDWANKSTNKNGITGKVRLTRKNTGHGVNGKANICVCSSNANNNFGTIGSLNRGESAWFNLPYNAIQQLINGGDLCFYSNNSNNYIQFENNIIVELFGNFII